MSGTEITPKTSLQLRSQQQNIRAFSETEQPEFQNAPKTSFEPELQKSHQENDFIEEDEQADFIRGTYLSLTILLAVLISTMYMLSVYTNVRNFCSGKLPFQIAVITLTIFALSAFYLVRNTIVRMKFLNVPILALFAILISALAAILLSLSGAFEVIASIIYIPALIGYLDMFARERLPDLSERTQKVERILMLFNSISSVIVIFVPSSIFILPFWFTIFLFYCSCFVIHTQLTDGTKSKKYSVGDELNATLCLYFDIMFVFLYLLKIMAVITKIYHYTRNNNA